MSDREFPYPGLPKWPQMRVAGPSVTPEQASEIIRRTDSFFTQGYSGNDREWNIRVKRIVGMRLGMDDPHFYDSAAKRDWEAEFAAEQAWREAWGIVDTQYVHNAWVSCSFVGGPHGWCSPMGTIYYRDNVGKWPSCERIERDWQSVAEAFPFVDCEVLLMSGESCEEDSQPVCGFIVKDGVVTPKLPTEHAFHQGAYAWANVGPTLEQQVMGLMVPARFREVGVSEDMVRHWAESVKVAA